MKCLQLQADVDRLNRQNKELSRKNKAIQIQGRILVEEKSELISQLQAREEHNITLEHLLAETDRARKHLEQSQVFSLFIVQYTKALISDSTNTSSLINGLERHHRL
jgi:hypothetical protein